MNFEQARDFIILSAGLGLAVFGAVSDQSDILYVGLAVAGINLATPVVKQVKQSKGASSDEKKTK